MSAPLRLFWMDCHKTPGDQVAYCREISKPDGTLIPQARMRQIGAEEFRAKVRLADGTFAEHTASDTFHLTAWVDIQWAKGRSDGEGV